MATVAFTKLSSNFRIPGTFIEIQPGANGAASNLQTLIIGQMLPTGTAIVNEPVFVTSAADARTQAGAGSMLAAMAHKYFESDDTGTVYLLPLADPLGGTHATGSVTLTGTASTTGTFALYVGGRRIAVGVNIGDTAATIAANTLAAALLIGATPFAA